jgi:hypothetical protein
MTTGMEALTQAQHKVAEALYKQAGSGGGTASSGEPSGGEGTASQPESGDVIDAEVVEDEKR